MGGRRKRGRGGRTKKPKKKKEQVGNVFSAIEYFVSAGACVAVLCMLCCVVLCFAILCVSCCALLC